MAIRSFQLFKIFAKHKCCVDGYFYIVIRRTFKNQRVPVLDFKTIGGTIAVYGSEQNVVFYYIGASFCKRHKIAGAELKHSCICV